MRKHWVMMPALFVAACASVQPTGPTLQVMPAPGKPFEVFMVEDQQCRGYALSANAGDEQKAQDAAGASVAVGAVVGTVIGVLVGGGRQGAGVGAGVGLLMGSAGGNEEMRNARREAQWRYNAAYAQCMYAKGNQVPGYALQLPPTAPTGPAEAAKPQ